MALDRPLCRPHVTGSIKFQSEELADDPGELKNTGSTRETSGCLADSFLSVSGSNDEETADVNSILTNKAKLVSGGSRNLGILGQPVKEFCGP